MDRDHTVIIEELEDLQNKDPKKYNKQRDLLFLEVLLDIRNELRCIRRSQGDSKWGSKL